MRMMKSAGIGPNGRISYSGTVFVPIEDRCQNIPVHINRTRGQWRYYNSGSICSFNDASAPFGVHS